MDDNADVTCAENSATMSLSFAERNEIVGEDFTICGCSIDAYAANWGWPKSANQSRDRVPANRPRFRGGPHWMEERCQNVPTCEYRRSRCNQSPGRLLYSFAVDGKQFPTFATVSRIRRNGIDARRVSASGGAFAHRRDSEVPRESVANGPERYSRGLRLTRSISNLSSMHRRGSAMPVAGTLVIPVDTVGGRGETWFHRRRSAAVGGYSRRRHRVVSDLRDRFHHERHQSADRAVHSGELHEALAERTHLRTAAEHGGDAADAPAAPAVSSFSP